MSDWRECGDEEGHDAGETKNAARPIEPTARGEHAT
jgi:hypothetical protein